MPQGDAAGGSSLIMLVFYIVFFGAIMYFMIYRPQKKREKKQRDMLGTMQVGQNITTVGGIMGKIVNIKDDELTIETGIDKTKIKITKWAVKEVEKLIEA